MARFTRRTFVRTATAAVVAIPGVGTVSATGQEENAGERERPERQPIISKFGMGQQFNVENHFDGDPAVESASAVTETSEDSTGSSQGRDCVVHVTSNGDQTRDYSAGLVNVADGFEAPITLADVDSSGQLTYDYYQGPENGNAAPDEVFLVVHKTEEGEAGSIDETGFFSVYKTINDGVDPSATDTADGAEEWRTVDVSQELTGGDRQWREQMIDESDVMSGEAVSRTGQLLWGNRDKFENALDRYGENARLVAVGYGKGSISRGTVVDVYYDNLVVRPEGYEPDDETSDSSDRRAFDFPAVVPMDAEFQPPQINPAGGGTLNATLSLRQDESGLSLDTVQEDTVRLTPFVSVAPPAEEGVTARSVRTTEDGLRAQFPVSDVVDTLQSGEQPIVISGESNGECPAHFVAEGTLTVRNQGP